MSNIKALGFQSCTKAAAKAMLFSLALPLFSSNAFAVRNDPLRKETTALRNGPVSTKIDNDSKLLVPKERGNPWCEVKGKEIEFISGAGIKKAPVDLLEGERIMDSTCIRDRAFILTDKRLLATTSMDGESRTVLAFTAWFDISDAHKKGIVAWTQSYDKCYLLTKDGKMAPIFIDETLRNKERTVYLIPFPVENAKIIEFAGVVFVAVEGENLMAFTFNDKSDSRYLPITAYPGSGFSKKGNRLYYGKEGRKEVEIKVRKGIQTLKDLEFSGL